MYTSVETKERIIYSQLGQAQVVYVYHYYSEG